MTGGRVARPLGIRRAWSSFRNCRLPRIGRPTPFTPDLASGFSEKSVSIRYRAISYDVGTFFVRGKSTRPNFDESLAKREIAIIKNELHCNAVRIFGQDIDRLMAATTLAVEEGLTVWLSPMLVDATGEQTLPSL